LLQTVGHGDSPTYLLSKVISYLETLINVPAGAPRSCIPTALSFPSPAATPPSGCQLAPFLPSSGFEARAPTYGILFVSRFHYQSSCIAKRLVHVYLACCFASAPRHPRLYGLIWFGIGKHGTVVSAFAWMAELGHCYLDHKASD
jgi:hypothetical protein